MLEARQHHCGRAYPGQCWPEGLQLLGKYDDCNSWVDLTYRGSPAGRTPELSFVTEAPYPLGLQQAGLKGLIATLRKTM